MFADLKTQLTSLHNDESGATATEYIILLTLIACFVIGIVRVFGATLSEKFATGHNAVKTQVVF